MKGVVDQILGDQCLLVSISNQSGFPYEDTQGILMCDVFACTNLPCNVVLLIRQRMLARSTMVFKLEMQNKRTRISGKKARRVEMKGVIDQILGDQRLQWLLEIGVAFLYQDTQGYPCSMVIIFQLASDHLAIAQEHICKLGSCYYKKVKQVDLLLVIVQSFMVLYIGGVHWQTCSCNQGKYRQI